MDIAVWHSKYETGNSEIDDQHKTLFKLINNLADATSQGASQEVLKQLLDELINETTIHFKTEEELVKPVGYGSYFSRKASHSYLRGVLVKVSENFEIDSSFLTLEIVQSIVDLIVRHICEEDMLMMQCFTRHQHLDCNFEVVSSLMMSQMVEP